MSRKSVNIYGQDAKKGYPISIAQSSDNVSAGAQSGAAAVVFPAQTAGSTVQGSWVIGGIFWSYSGPITAGRLTIADSSGTIFDQDLHSGSATNFGSTFFQPPLASQVPASALTVTLGAPGAAVSGKLTVQGWLEL